MQPDHEQLMSNSLNTVIFGAPHRNARILTALDYNLNYVFVDTYIIIFMECNYDSN
jgi:hypothetical protein